MELAKADKLYKDAMETTAQSGEAELAEELLKCVVARVLVPAAFLSATGFVEGWGIRSALCGRTWQRIC